MSKFKKGDRVLLNKGNEQYKRWSKGTIVENSALSVPTWSVDFGGDYPIWVLEDSLESDNGINLSLLDSYSISEVISHFGWENIIDAMDKDQVIEYLNK